MTDGVGPRNGGRPAVRYGRRTGDDAPRPAFPENRRDGRLLYTGPVTGGNLGAL